MAGMPQLGPLLAMMGGGGAPGGGMPPPGGPAGPDLGAAVGQMSSELQGADPNYLLTILQQCKSMLREAFIMASDRLPNVSGAVAMTMKQLDRAIKECQQAQSTASAVKGPVGMSMAGPAPGGAGGAGNFMSGAM